jgi:hypothetical protein
MARAEVVADPNAVVALEETANRAWTGWIAFIASGG